MAEREQRASDRLDAPGKSVHWLPERRQCQRMPRWAQWFSSPAIAARITGMAEIPSDVASLAAATDLRSTEGSPRAAVRLA